MLDCWTKFCGQESILNISKVPVTVSEERKEADDRDGWCLGH